MHGGAYLDKLGSLVGQRAQLDADTYLAPDSVVAVRRAAGGSVDLVKAMLAGQCQRGVALLRPPGHHARPNQAMGFCLLNNVAVAAAYALSAGLSRVAIVDWDVHHGNGTQEMFFSDPRVLYASLHQWPFYPGTGNAPEIGEGDGRGFTVNVPLSQGAHAGDYAAAFDRVLLPVLEAYRPELVLVSAGFDAHRDDPLAAMRLDAAAYGWMTDRLLKVAERTAEGKMALFLEGGYDLGALEESLSASLRVLAESRSWPGRPSAARARARSRDQAHPKSARTQLASLRLSILLRQFFAHGKRRQSPIRPDATRDLGEAAGTVISGVRARASALPASLRADSDCSAGT